MADTSAASDEPMSHDMDPSQFLRMQPKKSILKAKQTTSFELKDRGAHFDEMNIIATHHPADKDYGHMKIEEPKTPYHYSDGEASDGEGLGASRPRRVSLVGAVDVDAVAAGLEGGRRKSLPLEDSDSEEEMTEERKEKKAEFEKKRRAHYNEGAVLKHHVDVDDEEDEEGGPSKMKQ